MSNQISQSASPALPDEVVRPMSKTPTAEEQPAVTRAEVRKSERPWPRKTAAPRKERPVPLTGGKLVLLHLRQALVFMERVLTLGFVTVRRPTNPKLSREDAQTYELRALKKSVKTKAVRRPRKFTVVNSKGGVGKTPDAVYLGVFAQRYTGNSCALVDMNQNFGTAWRWIGVARSMTITVYAAVTSAPFKDIDEFNAVTAIHEETGLRFIASEDMDTTTAISEIIGEDPSALKDATIREKVFARFRAFTRNVKQFVHSVFYDTGNGMSHESNTAAVDAGDVLIFPGDWRDDDDIAGIQETLHGYIQRGYGPKIRERGFYMIHSCPNTSKENVFAKFCERIFAAHVAANFRGMSVDKMDRAYVESKSIEFAEQLGITIDRFFVVPYSKYIAEKHVASAKFRKVGRPTSAAILRVLDAAYSLDVDTDPKEETLEIEIDDELAKLYAEMQANHTTTA